MRVLVIGAGLMGAQIGCEYALGGHEVTALARHPVPAEERVRAALESVADLGLFSSQETEAAAARTSVVPQAPLAGWDVVVESVPEDPELKATLLRPVAEASPEAVLATNTSSLSITALGDAIGAPERTIGTHYWNPPLLMPLVEVVPGARTDPAVLEHVRKTVRALGKRPVTCRDVPGFAWNRLQMAVLREAIWLVEHGVASPETVDEVLTYGLGRRWSNIAFFQAIALGGVGTWQRAAANLLPQISAATELGDLERWMTANGDELAEAALRRDLGLARDLIEDRRQDGGR